MLTIAEKIKIIEEKIEKARARSPKAAAVKIIAVTKTVQIEKIENSLSCGITDIGENRVQEAEEKFPALSKYKIKKHLIGHLQTNKVKKAVSLFDLIQSVDSFRLLNEINAQSGAAGKVQECFVELKVSGEDSKYGLDPDKLEELLDSARSLKNITVSGLMAMAPYFENPADARPYFRRAYECYLKCAPSYQLKYLSMGMTGDFEAAVEEGSNMVRIGAGIYGERE